MDTCRNDRRRFTVIILAVAFVSLSACGADQSGDNPPRVPPDGSGSNGATVPLDTPAVMRTHADGQPGVVAVVDLRIGVHDGFDRIVFEFAGDGVAGWDLRYVDTAYAQGSGFVIDLAGDAVLAIALHNVTLPPELPADISRWDQDRVAPPPGSIIQELLHDTIFEGTQTFFVGLDAERAFRIGRFTDPQRIVIDVLREQ